MRDHFLGSCIEFKKPSKLDIDKWIREKEGGSKCGRIHKMDKCTLKRTCKICKEIHLTLLHDVSATKLATVMLTSSPSELLYIEKPHRSYKVILKVVNAFTMVNKLLKLTQSFMMVQIDLSCSPKLSSVLASQHSTKPSHYTQ